MSRLKDHLSKRNIYFKNYFTEIQRDITDTKNTVEDEISFEKDFSNESNNKKKDE